MSWLKLVLSAVVEVFAWLNSPRRQAQADAHAKDVAQASNDSAIQTGDENKVNARIQTIIKVVAVSFLLCSCQVPTKVIYVPADEKAIPIVYNGQQGWFVPNAIMQKLLDAADKGKAVK